MKVPESERRAIDTICQYGQLYGYVNLIGHLEAAFACELLDRGMDEEIARKQVLARDPIPLLLHEDIRYRGEWDETGERYR